MWSSRVGKLQEVEGIIKGMLMTLDIRIGTDIVVIKSSLYVKMQAAEIATVNFFIVSPFICTII